MESGNYHTSPIWEMRRWRTLSLGVRVGMCMGVPVRRVGVGEAVHAKVRREICYAVHVDGIDGKLMWMVMVCDGIRNQTSRPWIG